MHGVKYGKRDVFILFLGGRMRWEGILMLDNIKEGECCRLNVSGETGEADELRELARSLLID